MKAAEELAFWRSEHLSIPWDKVVGHTASFPALGMLRDSSSSSKGHK